jgi:hypothetical protein
MKNLRRWQKIAWKGAMHNTKDLLPQKIIIPNPNPNKNLKPWAKYKNPSVQGLCKIFQSNNHQVPNSKPYLEVGWVLA